jgi:hypothetical protein
MQGKASSASVTDSVTGGQATIALLLLSQAAWKAYSDCEKSAPNAALYKPLSDASAACSMYQTSGAC